ncbi:MAG: UTP--glucose-1-phosphate uridylyltransferase [Planctomycetes bacterium]|nr:UTP--glucose-1-phosphate uridylyltransferase [Planctomycetota bacterium]
MSRERYDRLRDLAEGRGQGHVLRFWDDLDEAGRERLLADVEAIEFDELDRLVSGDLVARIPDTRGARPATIDTLDAAESERMARAGEKALAAGEVGALLLAGGQGSRLGFHGPKGLFPIGPVSGKTLFEIHAARLRALGDKVGRSIPLIVLVSEENETATRAYVEANGNLGLRDLLLLRQRSLPAVDFDGKLILAERDRIFRSPNGHGGAIEALVRGGGIEFLRARGAEHVFTFQVDNVLVRPCDPAYAGLHIARGSEMSSKMLRKRSADEGLAVCAERDGRRFMIEYSDLPPDLMRARDAEGDLLYWAGSIAIFLFRLDFLERLEVEGVELPYHRARKKIPFVDEAGRRVQPAEENGLKFERFIFDALPQARASVQLEVAREEEFAPVKRAEGADSPAEARRLLSNLYARWLRAAGADVPLDADGNARVPVEIDPAFALGPEDLPAGLGARIRPGEPIYFEGRA